MRADYIPPVRLSKIRDRLGTTDKLIFDVCLETGTRIDDVLDLRKWQIHDGKIYVLESKTSHKRITSVSPGLYSRLSEHVKNKHVFAFVFPSRRPRRRTTKRKKLNRSTFWRNMVKAAHDCGYKTEQYTPHSLRKCYAVNLFQQTRSLEAVRRDLGHKHLSTTMLYAWSDRVDELGLY